MQRVTGFMLVAGITLLLPRPAAAVRIDLTGFSPAGDGGPPLEEIDGQSSISFTTHGISLTLTAVGGVLDCSPNGIGVSPVDSAQTSDISGNEAIVITFSQVTHWHYFVLEGYGAIAPGDDVGDSCVSVTYTHAGGTDVDATCPGIAVRVRPPAGASPVVLSDPATQSVRVARASAAMPGERFVLRTIDVAIAVADDAARDESDIAINLSRSGDLVFAAGSPPTAARVSVACLGPTTATGLTLGLTLDGCSVDSSTAPAGTTFDAGSGVWTLGTVHQGVAPTELALMLRPLAGAGDTAHVTVAVTALDQLNGGDSPVTLDIPISRPSDIGTGTELTPIGEVLVFLFTGCSSGMPLALVGTSAGCLWMRRSRRTRSRRV
ncbi:MAG: hypothetical protein U1A27_04725 [Phycisphaerae bacterium]